MRVPKGLLSTIVAYTANRNLLRASAGQGPLKNGVTNHNIIKLQAEKTRELSPGKKEFSTIYTEICCVVIKTNSQTGMYVVQAKCHARNDLLSAQNLKNIPEKYAISYGEEMRGRFQSTQI